jgi:8-oxo-dGTP pyrophosphatase MutT (NUDIX family)
MEVVYAKEKPPEKWTSSIFLAGPTPRGGDKSASWRPEAMKLLENAGFDGVVFNPEPRGKFHGDYLDQVEWEQEMRLRSDIVLFWVPRDPINMPAFTTNIEFGEDYKTGKVLYGRPDDAFKTRYLDAIYRQTGKEPSSDLGFLVGQAIGRIELLSKDIEVGFTREVGETYIPLHIWNTDQFQEWYLTLLGAGNRLDKARVENVTFVHERVFAFTLWVKVWVESEQRHKKNEFIFTRPDIVSIAPIYRDKDDPWKEASEQTYVVLVSEFRSPGRTQSGFVTELPGGAVSINPIISAVNELEEETGVEVNSSRLISVGQKQLAATFSTHVSTLFAVDLTKEEFDQVKKSAESGKIFGEEGSSERTRLKIVNVKDIKDEEIDWTTVGMITMALEEIWQKEKAKTNR